MSYVATVLEQTFIYSISCLALPLSEFGLTPTLFLQASPWDSLRVGFVGRPTRVSRAPPRAILYKMINVVNIAN